MAQPWSYSFAFYDGESDSEDDGVKISQPQQMQGLQFTKQPVEQEPSEDTRLARELDLSTRHDTAIFRKTPWTVAKSNAASRPARKASRPSFPQPHPPKYSDTSVVVTESTKGSKEVLKSKNLTDHFRQSSIRKESLEASVERTNKRPPAQGIIVKSDPPKKREVLPRPILSLAQRQLQPGRHAFVSPLKHVPSSLPSTPVLSLPHNQPMQSKVEVVLPVTDTNLPSASIPGKFIQPTFIAPPRLVVKKETFTSLVKGKVTPKVKNKTIASPAKKAGDTFQAPVLLINTASLTLLKRKRESCSPKISVAPPSVSQRPSPPVIKRVRMGESPPPHSKAVRSMTRQPQAAALRGNGALMSNEDEHWSTIQKKKALPKGSAKRASSNRLFTGGFRLPTSFLGVPRGANTMQGNARSKTTLLTLYQPPAPLPSTPPSRTSGKQVDSTSENSEGSGSGASNGSGGSLPGGTTTFARPSEDEDCNFRFTAADLGSKVGTNDQESPFAQEGEELHDESDIVLMDFADLHKRFPGFVNGLRERHRKLRVPLWELTAVASFGTTVDG